MSKFPQQALHINKPVLNSNDVRSLICDDTTIMRREALVWFQRNVQIRRPIRKCPHCCTCLKIGKCIKSCRLQAGVPSVIWKKHGQVLVGSCPVLVLTSLLPESFGHPKIQTSNPILMLYLHAFPYGHDDSPTLK